MLKLATKSIDDPLRVDLASKIEAARSAEAAVHAARARHAKAVLAASDVAAALATAELDVTRAKEKRIAQVAAGGAGASDGTVKSLRLRAADLSDELEICHGAVSQISEEIPDLEATLHRAEQAVDAAAKAVLCALMPALIARSKSQLAEFYRTRCALSFLHSSFPGLPTDDSRACEGFSGMAVAPGDGRDAAEWHSALAALKLDPEAPLPI